MCVCVGGVLASLCVWLQRHVFYLPPSFSTMCIVVLVRLNGSGDSFVCSPGAGILAVCYEAQLLGPRDLNSGPHVYVVNVFLIETSAQPQMLTFHGLFYYKIILSLLSLWIVYSH